MDFSAPKIMAILNATPDSFSDGGRFSASGAALAQIRRFIAQGADIIDVGGESTGPDSAEVSETEELARLRPIIDAVAEQKLTDRALFSIDTYKAAVARYALERGFKMVNDVTALRGDRNMLDTVTNFTPYVVLMYSKDGTPRTTREAVQYRDVIATVKTFLAERVATLAAAGFPKEKIILDPGMGMFVSAEPKYSYEIIERLDELLSLGCPILIGPSRKSFVGGDIRSRDKKSWELARHAIQNGAAIVRMHTVLNQT